MVSEFGEPLPRLGFWNQIRSQHWSVKLILVFVLSGPIATFFVFFALGAGAAFSDAFGGVLALVALGLSVWWHIWLFTGGDRRPAAIAPATLIAPAAPLPVMERAPAVESAPPLPAQSTRYCTGCGVAYPGAIAACPECAKLWAAEEFESIPSLATFLNTLTAQRNLLDRATFDRVQSAFEARLRRLRHPEPEAPPVPSTSLPFAIPVPPPLSASEPFATPAPPFPSAPEAFATTAPLQATATPPPPRRTAADARRAVIGFAAERQADILLYVGAFLLSVGAIVFVAYQGETLSGGIRFLILTTYALGFLIFGLLLHRWERVREAGPAFLALGAILVPIDFLMLRTEMLSEEQVATDVLLFFGSATSAALYFSLAGRGYGWLYAIPGAVAALVAWGALGSIINFGPEWYGAWFLLVAGPAYVVGQYFQGRWRFARGIVWPAIVIGAVAVPWSPDPGDAAAISAQFLLATTALAVGLRFRPSLPALIALPAMAAITAATAWWAAFGLDGEWVAMFIAAAAGGYLVAERFDPRSHLRLWGILAASAGGLALLVVHSTVALLEGADSAALPATYAFVFLLAVGAFARWHWIPAGIVMPALGAMTLLTAFWAAFEIGVEWYGVFAAVASAGYLLLAHFEGESRARLWGMLAASAGGLALLFAHSAAPLEGADSAALPATYAFLSLLADGAFARWRWTAAGALLPILGALTLLTSFWSARGIGTEWYGFFAALAACGYVLLGHFDRESRRALWLASGASAAALALGIVHLRVPLDAEADKVALPLTYAAVLAVASAVFARWRFEWRPAPAVTPLLAAGTALTAAWVRWDTDPEWFAAFIAAAVGGYVALALRDIDSWPRTWLRLGMAVAFAAAATLFGTELEAGADHVAVPVALGELLVFTGFMVAWWRTAFREAIAVVSPLVAGFGASVTWVAADMPVDWLAAWAAAAAVGYFVTATLDVGQRQIWRTAALSTGGVALVTSHLWAAEPDPVRWQLPVTYLVALVGALWDSISRRDAVMLVPPALAAMLGAATLWDRGVGPEWWPYPAIGIAIAIVLTRYWWRRDPLLDNWGWSQILLLGPGVAGVFLTVQYSQPEHAITTQLLAAGLLLATVIISDGTIARSLLQYRTPTSVLVERALLIQAAFAFLCGAGASLNRLLEVEAVDRAWVFAAIGFAGWLLVNLPLPRPSNSWTFAPIGLAGMTIAAVVAAESAATATAVLALATAGPLVALPSARRWTLLGIANAFFFLTVWAAWEWQEANPAYLPLAFAAIAVVQWAALTWLRSYARELRETNVVITLMSWGPWLVAAAVAGILLGQEQERLVPGASLVNTEEWGLAAAVLAMASAAVVGEGLRFQPRWLWLPGTVGLLAALLMGIATFEPDNVQAYTAPIGTYLILVALSFRRSQAFAGHHLLLHEALMLVGWLVLVLPPADQSFDPGGGKYGLELIGIGLVLLIVGLVLHARWLIPAAVLTLTGVSFRLLTGGLVSTPFWVLLSVAGTTLIGLGVLLLLEREAWDRFRASVVRWWNETQAGTPTLGGPTSPA